MLMRRWFRIRCCLAAGVAGVVLCACQEGSPAPEADPRCAVAETKVEPLSSESPVEGVLERGESRVFAFSARSGEHLVIAARQDGTDVRLRLCDPAGQVVREEDAILGLHSLERLEALAGKRGEHRLLVEVVEDAPGGRFELHLERNARPSDADRRRLELLEEAEQALADARKGFGARDDARSARVTRIEQDFSEAHDRFLAAGEPERAAEALVEMGTALWKEPGGLELEPAQRAFEKAEALWRGTGNLAGQASALHSAGLTYFKQERWEESLAAYRSALAVAEKAEDYRLEARALIGVGVLSKGANRAAEAEAAYQRVLTLAEPRGDLLFQCLASTRLGSLLGDRGEVARAMEVDRRSVELCALAAEKRERLGGSSGSNLDHQASGESGEALLELAGAWSNLGVDYQDLGKTREARDSFRRAAELAGERGLQDLSATVALNEGNLLLSLGQNAKARASYETALAIFEQTDDVRQVNVLLSLARLERAEEHYEEALVLAERASGRSGEAPPRLQAAVARVLGVALRDSGRGEEALRHLSHAAAEHRRLGDRWGEAASIGEIGESLRLAGHLEPARRRMEEAHALSRRVEDPILEALQLFRLAQVERDADRPGRAVEVLERALARFELVNRGVANPDTRATQIAFRRPFFELHVDALYQRDCGRRRSPACATAALEASESARARGLRDLLAEAEVEVASGVDPALKEREQAIRGQLSVIQRRILNLQRSTASDSLELAALSAERSTRLAQLDRLEQEVRIRNARYAEVHYPKALRLAEIQQRLLTDEGTALLEYALGESSSYLFVIRRQGVDVFPLAPAAKLRRHVEVMLRELSGSRAPNLNQAAVELYAALIRPAEPALAGVERLLIVPDDALFSVPFEALVERHEPGRRPTYLLDRWVVSYAPSATVLAQLVSSPPAAAQSNGGSLDFVAFADPLYPQPAASDTSPSSLAAVERGMFDPQGRLVLTRLAASQGEVEEIAALFAKAGGQVRLFVRNEATEENALGTEARAARNLHFAAHAFTDDRDSENLGLVLSQLPEARGDGVLQLDEIFDLKLAARLVVLSACGSALGKPVRGEGFVGLTRGFFYAGARSVVASLWNVEDRSTARLMAAFYRHLLASSERGKAEALRRAKLEVIASGASDPRYWAAFVIVGDPDDHDK